MSVARHARRLRLPHSVVPAALVVVLSAIPAGCGGGEEPAPAPSPSDQAADPSPSPSAEPIELPASVENPPWRGEVGANDRGELTVTSYNGDVSPVQHQTRVTFKSATATPEGVEFLLHFLWNVAEPDGEVYHSQIYAESGGERHTTGEEGVMTSYATAQATSEMVIEHTFVIPGAPESGAIFFQGETYEADGTGLPPIGVCYTAGAEFTAEGCA
ncbi:hypothetical protein ACFPZ0_27485 [Streptomonospora nanhaiensis]|uniref:Uncharacterized protein n=1 Tax=Streptomonospora nanhaiensis TaxID=1323731 RepID=A0A853BSC1_9ACTN|nr:hypothetical protein [Streptomonospora nanhaiensis]MBV2367187.1 hypothetical protein [Streptomonospora nanhaiensis]MBX9391887.1 hypothetical protein [Streptomonospora nanhaiensis]NYI97625.1 hypothetical protein [Streptomonospora nanhaiensis]